MERVVLRSNTGQNSHTTLTPWQLNKVRLRLFKERYHKSKTRRTSIKPREPLIRQVWGEQKARKKVQGIQIGRSCKFCPIFLSSTIKQCLLTGADDHFN